MQNAKEVECKKVILLYHRHIKFKFNIISKKIIVSKLYKEKSEILFSFILQTILLTQLYLNKNSYYHNLYLYLFYSYHEDYYLLLIELCPIENFIFVLLDETKVEKNRQK